MEEETEINNNDLNNNTDFEEEALAADHLADIADMNPNDIMENLQNTLLQEAKLVRERIGYQVSIDQIYHYLEVAVDQANRVQYVVENLQARIDQGEFAEAMKKESNAPSDQNIIDVTEDSPIIELNDSLTYVPDEVSDDQEEEEDHRMRPGKRKQERENRVMNDANLEIELDLIGEEMADNQMQQADLNIKMEEDLHQLCILFPHKSLDEMRGMYLAICNIEKENTLNVLATQMYDTEEAEGFVSPPKRPRRDANAAGPSRARGSTHLEQLNQMCEIIPKEEMTREDLKRKGDELNWDKKLIEAFIETRLQSGDAQVVEAGPSNQRPPSPQAGPSHEAEEEEEVQEQEHDDISKKLAHFMEVLGDADPEFLRHQVLKLHKDEKACSDFLYQALDKKGYPTKEEYEQRKKLEEQIKAFTGRMTVPEFLKHFPNPKEHFESKIDGDKDLLYQKHCLAFLKERFPQIHVKIIAATFNKSYNLTKAVAALEKEKPKRQSRRSVYEHRQPIEQHLYFLQEATYINKRQDIKDYFKSIEEARKQAFEQAKARNELHECPVCCENECLFEDMTACAEGHLFCKNCVKRYAEEGIGSSKNKFPCLDAGCKSEFPLQILKDVLETKVFACLARRLQTEEIRAAMIPDLETCPSCPFSYIPDEQSLVFECQEETCKKVTCRKCKEPNHLPLKCEEVEKDIETIARKEIEERMTEALVRACPKCKNKFVKTDGCNKMTCQCGTKSCYICRQVIQDYNHFHQRDQGANPKNLCPLYSNNDELHVRQVMEEGEKAKKEAEKKGVTLKHDPTKVAPVATGGGGHPAYQGYVQNLQDLFARQMFAPLLEGPYVPHFQNVRLVNPRGQQQQQPQQDDANQARQNVIRLNLNPAGRYQAILGQFQEQNRAFHALHHPAAPQRNQPPNADNRPRPPDPNRRPPAPPDFRQGVNRIFEVVRDGNEVVGAGGLLEQQQQQPGNVVIMLNQNRQPPPLPHGIGGNQGRYDVRWQLNPAAQQLAMPPRVAPRAGPASPRMCFLGNYPEYRAREIAEKVAKRREALERLRMAQADLNNVWPRNLDAQRARHQRLVENEQFRQPAAYNPNPVQNQPAGTAEAQPNQPGAQLGGANPRCQADNRIKLVLLSMNRMVEAIARAENITQHEMNEYRRLFFGLKKLKSKLRNNLAFQDHLLNLKKRFKRVTENNKALKKYKKELKQQSQTTTSNKTPQPGSSRKPDDDNPGGSTSPESDDYVNNFQFDD